MIVVDASAVTDFLLGRSKTVEAVIEATEPDPNQPLYAPDVVEPETLNALRRLARAGLVSEERASAAVSDLESLRLVRLPHAPLRERVWQLRHRLTAYDASYLALAEALDDPLLLTADRALADAAAESLGAGAVRRL